MIDVDKCKITRYPKDVLAKPSKPIEQIDDTIKKLAGKMIDIMMDYKGIGLAAPQAGVPLRMFVIALDGKRESARVYINPTVTTEGTLENLDEGCLSVPQVHTKVKRYSKCTVTATDLDGNEFTEDAQDLYARCLQHEYDHIEGVTIVNRMGTAAKIVHRRKLKKLAEELDD